MSDRASQPSRVSISGGVQAIVLAPVSLFVAGVVALVAFPLMLAGPLPYLGAVFGAGLFVATLGIAAGAVSVSKAHRSRAGATRRDEAITIGILGVILSGLAAVVYVTLWMYLPSQIVYSPLWS